MMMKHRLLALLAVFAMFTAMDANAQASQNINVQATVNPTCVIDGSGTDLSFDFGVVDVTGGTDSNTSATFTWRCSNGTPVQIELDAGDNAGSAPATARQLVNDGNSGTPINYLLCQDVNCATPWGDGTTASDIVTSGTGMGNPATVEIFGILDGATAQNANPGTYTETVVLSLNF
jgi:spore coat protein U-like protein